MAFGFIDFAKEVLEASDRPLSVEEMWEAGCKRGLDGKLGSVSYTHLVLLLYQATAKKQYFNQCLY